MAYLQDDSVLPFLFEDEMTYSVEMPMSIKGFSSD